MHRPRCHEQRVARTELVAFVIDDEGPLPLDDDVDFILLVRGLHVLSARGVKSKLKRAVAESHRPVLVSPDRPLQHLLKRATIKVGHDLTS